MKVCHLVCGCAGTFLLKASSVHCAHIWLEITKLSAIIECAAGSSSCGQEQTSNRSQYRRARDIAIANGDSVAAQLATNERTNGAVRDTRRRSREQQLREEGDTAALERQRLQRARERANAKLSVETFFSKKPSFLNRTPERAAIDPLPTRAQYVCQFPKNTLPRAIPAVVASASSFVANDAMDVEDAQPLTNQQAYGVHVHG